MYYDRAMSKKQAYTDINQQHWSVKGLSARLKPYAMLARWDRPIGIHLLLIPCLIGLFSHPQIGTLSIYQCLFYGMLFLIGAIAMRGAGCTINDLWDQDLDRQVTRTQNRPLAARTLSKKKAFLFLSMQCVVGLLVLLQLNEGAIVVGLCSIPLVITYPLMKRITFWPQLFLGITFNCGLLVGAMAVAPFYDLGILVLYASLVLWTLAYDTIYAYQDIDDDIKVGVRSTARLFSGYGRSAIISFYLLHGVVLNTGLWMLGKAWAVLLLMAFVNLGFTAWIAQRFDEKSPSLCLSLFKINARYGYSIVFLLILDILWHLVLPFG